MRYTRKRKLGMVRELQRAKTLLRGDGHGGNTYICNALGTSYDAHMARALIMERLYPASTVSSWLRQNKHIKHDSDDVDSKWLDEQVQAYRHRWVDELIRELSE